MTNEELLIIAAGLVAVYLLWKDGLPAEKVINIKPEDTIELQSQPTINPETQKQPIISTNNAQQLPTKVETGK